MPLKFGANVLPTLGQRPQHVRQGVLGKHRLSGTRQLAEPRCEIDGRADSCVALPDRGSKHSHQGVSRPDSARARRQLFSFAVKAGVELRRPLNLIAGSENGTQRMVGEIAGRSIDSEHGVSRCFSHGAAGLTHSLARFLHKRIHHQFHFPWSKAVGELRQTLKLCACNSQIPPLRMPHGTKFFLAERFQGRSARSAQGACERIWCGKLIQHDVEDSPIGIQLRLENSPGPVRDKPVACAFGHGTRKARGKLPITESGHLLERRADEGFFWSSQIGRESVIRVDDDIVEGDSCDHRPNRSALIGRH